PPIPSSSAQVARALGSGALLDREVHHEGSTRCHHALSPRLDPHRRSVFCGRPLQGARYVGSAGDRALGFTAAPRKGGDSASERPEDQRLLSLPPDCERLRLLHQHPCPSLSMWRSALRRGAPRWLIRHSRKSKEIRMRKLFAILALGLATSAP